MRRGYSRFIGGCHSGCSPAAPLLSRAVPESPRAEAAGEWKSCFTGISADRAALFCTPCVLSAIGDEGHFLYSTGRVQLVRARLDTLEQGRSICKGGETRDSGSRAWAVPGSWRKWPPQRNTNGTAPRTSASARELSPRALRGRSGETWALQGKALEFLQMWGIHRVRKAEFCYCCCNPVWSPKSRRPGFCYTYMK